MKRKKILVNYLKKSTKFFIELKPGEKGRSTLSRGFFKQVIIVLWSVFHKSVSLVILEKLLQKIALKNFFLSSQEPFSFPNSEV